jgi:hypothetical protein
MTDDGWMLTENQCVAMMMVVDGFMKAMLGTVHVHGDDDDD